MTTNVWGCDYRMCVSDRAFADYQTQAEHKKLMQAYRRAGIKRFHYTNSGTLEYMHSKYTQATCFVSYYTFILEYEIDDVTKDVYMKVNPFVFLKDEYMNSSTTNRQTNRWLAENGFKFTIQDIAHLYDNAIRGIESYPMQRYVEGTATVLVHPYFSNYQTYLNDDGTQSHERSIDKVPWLEYNEQQSALVRVGTTFGVKYE